MIYYLKNFLMSLINCPDCGSVRSNQAGSVCPKCGHVMGAKKAAQESFVEFKKKSKELQKALKTHNIIGLVGLISWAVFGLKAMSQYEDVGPTWKISFFICVSGGLLFFTCVKEAGKINKNLKKHLDKK